MQTSWGSTFEGTPAPVGRCRGQIIAGFIVDFYCHKAALVIELDGSVHDLQQKEDANREKALKDIGLRIVRFGNDEILRNLSTVLEKIKELTFTRSA